MSRLRSGNGCRMRCEVALVRRMSSPRYVRVFAEGFGDPQAYKRLK